MRAYESCRSSNQCTRPIGGIDPRIAIHKSHMSQPGDASLVRSWLEPIGRMWDS
jgi:hypothetical protein